jgi:two-component system, OmpR family, response regulator
MARRIPLPVPVNMTPPSFADFIGRHIVVADADPAVVGFVISVLRDDGHAVFHAYDGLSAVELVYNLSSCHLLISNTNVAGVPGIDLIHHLRVDYPRLPMLYLANLGFSTPEIERELPSDVPILREPFTAAELRAAVRALLGEQPVNEPPAPRRTPV